MSVQETIRKLDSEGISGRKIAVQLNLSRATVAKYLRITNYSPAPPKAGKRPAGSVITGFEETISTWLEDDIGQPRKQRHTAQRIFDRLVDEENYQGTYSPVQRFVKRYKQERQSENDGFLELEWAPGTIQVDFGEAEVFLAGERKVVHLFVVTFPYSNMRFAQAYGGETSECVCHGLRTVFEHIGSVPHRMIFDNATGVGRRVKTKVLETKLFAAFKAHYRSEAKYCNPYSGNEKGNVENAVGFLRRNLMVPLPHAATLEGLNKVLLERCDRFGGKPHWRRRTLIKDLFEQDVQAGLALPGAGFDPVRYESRKADKYGHLQVGSNTYAAGPVFARRSLTVGIRHDVIEIL
ncbi:IS21 family transposase, partial [Glutamicibacter arilaitensis]